jgi:D-arabinose 1-dehydrogenase-like Zn-dependent alcohol dehydrogenase
LEHENLKLGQFNQFTHNRMLAGGVCGIFGFGGIGAATGRLRHGIGMRVHAINRHGQTNERVDWIGTPERLNELLEAADVLVISAPLTRATRVTLPAPTESALTLTILRPPALGRVGLPAPAGTEVGAKELRSGVVSHDKARPAVALATGRTLR